MRAPRSIHPLVIGLVALAFLGACGAALSEGHATEPPVPPAPLAATPSLDAGADADADASPPSRGADAGVAGCVNGTVLDGHSGQERCRRDDELPREPDGGAEADAGAPSDAGREPDGADASDAAAPPPMVTVGPPVFEGGDVPNLDKLLAKLASDVGRCVADAGGLSAKSGRLELTFLVRARGRAEGVEVQRVKGAPEAAGACVQKLLKNRRVGTPSEDPVGVTVSFELAR
jgi:hypothetical protein